MGNLDERIFLGEDADEEIGTLTRCLNTPSGVETAERVQVKHNLQQHFDRVSMAWSMLLFLYATFPGSLWRQKLDTSRSVGIKWEAYWELDFMVKNVMCLLK